MDSIIIEFCTCGRFHLFEIHKDKHRRTDWYIDTTLQSFCYAKHEGRRQIIKEEEEITERTLYRHQ
jgi:hypothetical protein